MDKKEILNDIYNIVKKDLTDIGIPISVCICSEIKLSSAKTRWGCCKQIQSRGNTFFQISISESCFNEPDYLSFIKNTMAHELIHTVKGCFNHGSEFKKYALIAKDAGYDVTVSSRSSIEKSDDEKFNEAKHVLKCVKCGEMYYRLRFSKKRGYINKIRCGKCGGKLIKIK